MVHMTRHERYRYSYVVLRKPYKIVNKWIHKDPFPNAIPEIRYDYKVDKVIRTSEYDPMNAKENESMYDGCDISPYL